MMQENFEQRNTMKVLIEYLPQMAQAIKKFQHVMELFIYLLSISNILLKSKWNL